MKIRQFLSAITIASLGLFGVSCKSTGTAKGGGDDGAYVGGYDSGNGEYDNVYEMGGSDDASYSYETADNSSSSSSYNYESNDYSSSPAPSKPKYVPVPEPAYTPPPSKPSSSPAPSANRSTHTVERGDTLFNISRRYGTSVAAIQNANGLNGDLIKIGETLTIP